MGYGNVKGLKIIWKRKDGRKVWFVEFNGAIVSDELKTREQAIQEVQPAIVAIHNARYKS